MEKWREEGEYLTKDEETQGVSGTGRPEEEEGAERGEVQVNSKEGMEVEVQSFLPFLTCYH